jgi:hypothetical protein
VSGGVGIAKSLYVGTALNVSGTGFNNINQTNTGAAGSGFTQLYQGLKTSMNSGENVTMNMGNAASTNNSGYIGFCYAGGAGSASNYMAIGLYGNDLLLRVLGSGAVVIPTTTDSSSTTTGVLQVSGGVGIAKSLYVNSTLIVTTTGLTCQGPGGSGSNATFNISSYAPGSNASAACIQTTDDGNSGNQIQILSKTPGATTNSLIPRLTISDNGLCAIYGGSTTSTLPNSTWAGTVAAPNFRTLSLYSQNAGPTGGFSVDKDNASSSDVHILCRTATASGTGFTFMQCQTACGQGLGFQNGPAGSGFTTVFNVAGNGNVTNTNNSYGAVSDIKLKMNVTPSRDYLTDLNRLQVVKFNWKKAPEEPKQLGLIAQQVESIFPSLIEITEDKDAEGEPLGTTTKSVKYSVINMMMLKAIQELSSQIEDLKSQCCDCKK